MVCNQHRLILLMLFLLFASSCKRAESVRQFRSFHIGDQVKHYSISSEKYKPACFFVFFVNDTLPVTCINEECGNIADSIVKRGGRLYASGDTKYAKRFDIALVSAEPWKFDASLLIIADREGKIIKLYTEVFPREIEQLITKMENYPILESNQKNQCT